MDVQSKIIEFVAQEAQWLMCKMQAMHPFAVVMENDGKIRQLTIAWEDEHPNAAELAAAMEAVVHVRLQHESIICGVVCVDVLYRASQQSVKQDAIQMKLLMNYKTEYYFQPYILDGGMFVFADIVHDKMR